MPTIKFWNPASDAEKVEQLKVLFRQFYTPAVRLVSCQDACIVVHCPDHNKSLAGKQPEAADKPC